MEYTKKEYNDLIINFKQNDLASIKKLYKIGIWYSAKAASNYIQYPIALEELLMAGFSGWLKAIEHFDISKDYKFSIYALDWIKLEIHELLELEDEE